MSRPVIDSRSDSLRRAVIIGNRHEVPIDPSRRVPIALVPRLGIARGKLGDLGLETGVEYGPPAKDHTVSQTLV